MRGSSRAAPATRAWSSCRAATGAPRPTSERLSPRSSASSKSSPGTRTSPAARPGYDRSDDVKAKLQQRARAHGRSMEEEAREILRNAVRESDATPARLGSQIAARFVDIGMDEAIPELR